MTNKDEEIIEPEVLDDFDQDADAEQFIDPETISSSLQLAALISQPSEVLKNFPEITKEVRNAFLDDTQTKELRHRHKAYWTFMYIRKILKLQTKEDKNNLDNRRAIFDVKTKEDLHIYFKKNGKSNIYSQLLKEYEPEVLLNDIKQIDRDCIEEDIYEITTKVNTMFRNFAKENNKQEFIDDVGNLAIIQNEAILSAGKQGNERYAGITSIGATRDIDLKEKIKKETQYENPLQKIIRKFK